MKNNSKRLHDFYNMRPGARIVQTEFGFYSLEKWREQGFITAETNTNELFGFDCMAQHSLGQLGWCEAGLSPQFDTVVLEDRGDYELVQDFAGRSVLYFKGRRQGFMPEYVDHPVKDQKSWEEKIKWRMNPASPERYADLPARMAQAQAAAADGCMIVQNLIGGYMYLRSLIGPEDLLYLFYDDPALIHNCMETWFTLADTVIARHQEQITLDEVFFGEDICYNNGALISPDMMREFLLPYYQQLIDNIKIRQQDKARRLFIQIDTDGHCHNVIDIYKEIGMDYMSPFEVASGCDVVALRQKHPDLRMMGGIDKRILAESKEAIDREIGRIMPFMVQRGGYIPTCDHGVPEEVPFENYMHYRKRMREF